MKFVSPYRPFAPESVEHQKLGAFDWPGALGMLRDSVRRVMPGVRVWALTDDATKLPIKAHRYPVRESRLMLWIVDVSLQYLKSEDFDQDTVFASPDLLVFADLSPWFKADYGVLVREPKFAEKWPLLNVVQFWRHSAKDRLITFFARVLEKAKAESEPVLTWGADSYPIAELLAPLELGVFERDGLSVCGIPCGDVVRAMTSAELKKLESGRRVERPKVPVVEFRYLRKQKMRQYFEQTIGARR